MRWVATGGAIIAGFVASAAPASAAPIAPYDGSPPFNCEIQDVGKGTAFKDPHADPFCVRFDKTGQNITQLGIADFLLQEPARVAVALDKCFYYQSDHWTGSIVQGAAPELYNFEGRYFFDLAYAGGGVEVHDLRIGGQTVDPSILPGIPAEYRPYFGPGRGGARVDSGFAANPRCVALAQQKPVYRVAGQPKGCRLAGGRVGRGIGGIGLSATRARVLAVLGKPTSESPRALRYCLEDGSLLSAAFSGPGQRAKVVAVKSDHPAFTVHGVGAGTPEGAARKILRGEMVLGERNGERLLVLRQRARTLVVSARGGTVRYVAVARPRAGAGALGRALRLVR